MFESDNYINAFTAGMNTDDVALHCESTNTNDDEKIDWMTPHALAFGWSPGEGGLAVPSQMPAPRYCSGDWWRDVPPYKRQLSASGRAGDGSGGAAHLWVWGVASSDRR